jgi:hypothetical protein
VDNAKAAEKKHEVERLRERGEEGRVEGETSVSVSASGASFSNVRATGRPRPATGENAATGEVRWAGARGELQRGRSYVRLRSRARTSRNSKREARATTDKYF